MRRHESVKTEKNFVLYAYKCWHQYAPKGDSIILLSFKPQMNWSYIYSSYKSKWKCHTLKYAYDNNFESYGL